jgi:hypothetical protein
MPDIHVAQWVGTPNNLGGTDWAPAISGPPPWAAADLREDETQGGFCIVIGDGLTGSLRNLGHHAAQATNTNRNFARNQLGVTITANGQPLTNAELVIEAWTQGPEVDPSSGRLRRLPLNLSTGRFELHWFGQLLGHKEP